MEDLNESIRYTGESFFLFFFKVERHTSVVLVEHVCVDTLTCFLDECHKFVKSSIENQKESYLMRENLRLSRRWNKRRSHLIFVILSNHSITL